MKKIILVAVLATVTACSEPAPAPDATPAAETPEPAVAALAADGQPTPGMYKVTTSDGTVLMEDVKADGTYVQTKDGEVVETGKWEQRSPTQYCYAVDEQYVDQDSSAEMECNTEALGDDGVWTSTNPKGQVATVERATT